MEVDVSAWTYIFMTGMEGIREIVALLIILATDGATSLGGAPVHTNGVVRGKVTNILLIIDLYFCQGLTASPTLMSPAAGHNGHIGQNLAEATIIKHQTPTRMPSE